MLAVRHAIDALAPAAQEHVAPTADHTVVRMARRVDPAQVAL